MNYFDEFDWARMLNQHPVQNYNLIEYHNILCPQSDYPDFLDKYLELPVLKRLSGVGLLCGTDWTPLYKNRMYYSRLDHSVGVALIIWHFTHDKAQTLAGLFHDISTPVFSHVSDFRKGDALTQTVTEAPTSAIIRGDVQLQKLLYDDGLTNGQVEDYHIYPVADNEIPQLSADRLEYMFPSGMALDGSWTMEEVRTCYEDILLLKNENGEPELGFKTLEVAEEYCRHFCMIGHILQLNENKLTLHLLGQVMNLAEKLEVVDESDFMVLSEAQVIAKLENWCESVDFQKDSDTDGFDRDGSDKHNSDEEKKSLLRLFRAFRTMTSIEHTETALDEKKYFCVSLNVKQRYINPLVCCEDGKVLRLYDVSEKAHRIIDDFKVFEDTKWGCVRLV